MAVEGGVVVKTVQSRASVAVALSQPIVAAGVFGDTYGELTTGEANFTAAANALLDRVWMRTLRRSGQAAAARVQKHFGIAPGFHHLVDPTTASHPATWILEDFVSATIAAGACGVVFGFAEHLTPGDPTTLLGVGFKCGADQIWHTFVNDCPTNVAPVTVRRDTVIVGNPLSTDIHRLTLVIDGLTKTITWMVDRTVVDIWIPEAPLDQMRASPGPLILWAASVPSLGDARIRYHGGGIPQLRILVR